MSAKNDLVVTGKGTDKASQTVKRDKGTIRVTGKGKAVISRFVALTALPLTARVDMNNVKPLLKTADTLTVFGHDNNTLSIARVIDSVVVDMINGNELDSKKLIESCFAAHTTTSRVVGKPVAKQVDATFTKVISHLKGFNTGMTHHVKYLKKRMTGKGYTALQINDICNGLWPTLSALRVDMMRGKKAAKAFYAKA